MNGYHKFRRIAKQSFPFLLVAFIASIFIIGIIGFYRIAAQEKVNFPGALYAVLNMFIMESGDAYMPNWYIAFARFGAATLLGYGIFISIYKYIYNWWITFKIKYFYKKHTVIYGLGNVGGHIATELLEAKKKVVVVEKNLENDNILKIREMGGIVIIGNALEKHDQLKAGIAKASYCLILTGSDEINLQITNLLTFINRQGIIKNHLDVKVHVQDWYNNNFIKDYVDLFNKSENCNIDPFNIYQAGAQLVYDKYPPWKRITYKQTISNTGEIAVEASEVTIAVIGFTKTTEAFFAECFILSHSPGLKNMRIIFIEHHVEKCLQELRYRFPFIDEYLEIVPVELNNENFYGKKFQSDAFLDEIQKVHIVYVFGNHDAYTMTLANGFRQLLYAENQDINKTPIVLCLPEKSRILDLLNPASLRGMKHDIQLFNTLKKSFNMSVVQLFHDTCTKARLIDESETVDALAKVINYFYSFKYEFLWLLPENKRERFTNQHMQKIEDAFLTAPVKTNSPLKEIENIVLEALEMIVAIPKSRLKPIFGIYARWNDITDIKQESNRYVARHLGVKVDFLRKMGIPDNMNRNDILKYFKILAPVEHKRWYSEKLVHKFRYAAFPEDNASLKKDLKDILKVHNQLIDFEDLDAEMEDKDFNMFLLIALLQRIKNRLRTA